MPVSLLAVVTMMIVNSEALEVLSGMGDEVGEMIFTPEKWC